MFPYYNDKITELGKDNILSMEKKVILGIQRMYCNRRTSTSTSTSTTTRMISTTPTTTSTTPTTIYTITSTSQLVLYIHTKSNWIRLICQYLE